jgi:ketosteroid isomerase-like protein
MKTIFSFFLIFLFATNIFAQDELAIRQTLRDQIEAWNHGNIDDFMKAYWKSDSLTFISRDGITRGYDATLSRYKRNYSDTAKMGKLSYTLLSIKKLSAEYYFVIGKWSLKRSVGDIGGLYTLLFRKIKSKWFIITDHTS